MPAEIMASTGTVIPHTDAPHSSRCMASNARHNSITDSIADSLTEQRRTGKISVWWLGELERHGRALAVMMDKELILIGEFTYLMRINKINFIDPTQGEIPSETHYSKPRLFK